MAKIERLSPGKTGLIVIDMQEKFRPAIREFEAVALKTATLVNGFTILRLPVIVTEQYPKGLGKTVDIVNACCMNVATVEKTAFSCTDADGFMRLIEKAEVSDLVICGIETHVCVNQTAIELLASGWRVHIAVDATGSRNEIDHTTALRKLEMAGAVPSTTEMVLFELLRSADSPYFKDVQRLIK